MLFSGIFVRPVCRFAISRDFFLNYITVSFCKDVLLEDKNFRVSLYEYTRISRVLFIAV